MTLLKLGKITAVLLLMLMAVPPAQAQTLVFSHEKSYPTTVKRWTKAITAASFESASWITPIEGVLGRDSKHRHKHRDTILMVPHASIGDDITLVVWLHGLGGFGAREFQNRLIPQVEALLLEGHSVAIAIPEMPWSTNTKTPRSRQGQVFRQTGSFENYIAQMQVTLGHWLYKRDGVRPGLMRLAVVGHSAGGSALASAGREGGLCRVQPDFVVWSDASYGTWLDRAWKGCLSDAKQTTRTYVLVREGDKPHRNLKRLIKGKEEEDQPEVDILPRKYFTHTNIGDRVLLMSPIFGPGC